MTAKSADENRSLRQELDQVRNDLQGVAEEVRVKVHLAGMEAKDAWAELQPKLDEYERRLATVSRDVGHELRDIGRDLKAQLEKLRKRIG